MKNQKQNYIFLKTSLLFSCACFLFFISCAVSYADSNCDVLTGDAEDQCRDLEKKAKVYQSIIDLKNKQQDTLAIQMKSIDQEQEKNKTAIQATQKNLQTISQQINDLERDITDKEQSINSQKLVLAGLMQSYYDYDQQGVLDVVLIDKDFSDTIAQGDHIEQSGAKTSEILTSIETTFNALTEERKQLISKKQENDQMKNDLLDKSGDLLATENQKQTLLAQTQGDEIKYKGLLQRVEAQKKELFNFSEASNIDEVNASVGNYDKPSSNLASTSWYFSQKDSRWGNNKIGNSSSLMKDYGCAVTSLAMVFRKMGSSVDPGKLAKQKIFSFDLIQWPGSWDPKISMASSTSHGNVSWSKIDSKIKDGNPVIVYIGKSNGRGGHYVVITGKDSKDYIVHDPYFGPNLYLGTSRALVGKIGVDSKTTVNQMIIYD